MSVDEFLASDTLPEGTSLPLAALWRMARGDWDKAHHLVNDEEGREAAWVHAHLHRFEGDLDNAGYWYARAGRPPSTLPLDAERKAIIAALLAAATGD